MRDDDDEYKPSGCLESIGMAVVVLLLIAVLAGCCGCSWAVIAKCFIWGKRLIL